ncbi:hypothetical protein [Ramlibacter albus]|uniref:Uncharacterized protein n=1 Tax=Ramlibacter albus TaxID=2079448 RepID=A0A923M8Y9_9BURK|nr:hypothetical protein [Ramlibacter albus]MBC5764939.1 hypothetical protein [Ramlibacter albus]
MDIIELRQLCLGVLHDCSGPATEQLRRRLQCASTPQEIWMARCDMFQLVASQHCQSQAATRINSLLPAFSGWLPERLLAVV